MNPLLKDGVGNIAWLMDIVKKPFGDRLVVISEGFPPRKFLPEAYNFRLCEHLFLPGV